MAIYNTKYFLTADAGKTSFLDLRLQAGTLSLDSQNATVTGSAQVDYVYASKDVSIDFTNSGAGIDRLYLDGALSDYTMSVSGSVLTLTRIVGAKTVTYKINTTEDMVVFTNGASTAAALATAQANSTVPVLDTATTSLTTPVLADVASKTVTSLQTPGTVVAAVKPATLVVSGSAGVDKVYVKAGADVNATGLGGSVDQIYLTGKWSDYTKTQVGTTLTLKRTINGAEEKVVVSAGSGVLNDKLFFADGNISTLTAQTAIKTNALVTLAGAGGLTGATAAKTPLPTMAAATITAISDDSGIAADFITKTAAQTITGTYAGALEIGDKIQVKINGAWVDATATATGLTAGTFTVAGTLAENVNNLEVRLLSASGGSLAGTGKSVTLDTDTPTAATLTVKTGQNALVNAAETGVDIEIPTADIHAGDTIELKVGGASAVPPITLTVTQAMLTAASTAGTGIFINVPKAALAEGDNTLSIITTDVAGNTNDNTGVTLVINKDTQTPTQSIEISTTQADGTAWGTAVINDQYINSAETTELLKISGGLSANNQQFKEGDKIQLLKDGVAFGAERTVTADEATANALFVSVAKADLGANDGSFNFTVKATDAAGNTATSTAAATITLDTHAAAPILTVSATETDGTTARSAEQQNQFVGAAENNILLKIVGDTTATGGAFKVGDVVTLQYLGTDNLLHDLVKKGTPDSTYTATVGADGEVIYVDVAKSDLTSGLNNLVAKVVDLAGNSGTSNTLGARVLGDITITNADMKAGGVDQLDVNSQIVLTASEPLTSTSGVAGKKIRIVNDANTATKDGFGETTTNSFEIDAADTRYVTIVGNKIIIKPPFDFDFSNNYHVEVDAGAFTVIASINGSDVTVGSAEVAVADNLNFSTVDLGTDIATALQGQKMDDTGALVNGKKWINIENKGDPNGTAADLDLASADYALVFRDGNPQGSNPTGKDGVGVKANFNVNVTNFDAGDLIYADDQSNDKAALNDKQISQVSNDGTTTGIRFDGDGTNGIDAGLITFNSGTSATESAVRDQLDISNARLGTPITGITRVDTAVGGHPANLLGGSDISATHTLQIKVSSTGFKAGDKVQLIFTDANGAEVNLGAEATVSPTDVTAGFVTVSVTDVSAFEQGTNMLYAKLTNTDGAVTRSSIINDGAGIDYDSTNPAPTIAPASGENTVLVDAETQVNIFIDGSTLSIGDVITLQGTTLATAPTHTVVEADLATGVTFTVLKSNLVEGTNTLTAHVVDVAGNTGTAALSVTVEAYTTVSGFVGAGPVLAGNDLKVSAYDALGNLLGEDISVDATTGAYSLRVLKNSGPIVLKVTSTAPGNDYMDEATAAGADLSTNTIMAVQNVGATNVDVNINTLTDLAARHLTTNGILNNGVTAQAITDTNVAISKAFIDAASNADITSLTPAFTVDTTGSSTLGTANTLGKVLAQLSAQAKTLGVDAAQQAVANSLTWTGNTAATQATNGQAQQVSLLVKVANAAALATGSDASSVLAIADLTALNLTGYAALTATRQASVIADIVATANDGSAVQTVAQVQALVNKQTALTKLEAFAEQGTTAPTLQDYLDAGYSTVSASSLTAVNSALDANNAAADAATDAQVATLVANGIAAQTAALAAITSYATANTNAQPTLQDYVTAGIVGVTKQNLNAVNAVIDAAAGSADAGTVAQVDALVLTAQANFEAAYLVLRNYAIDPVSNPVPTLDHFHLAGVSSATATNLDQAKSVLRAVGTTPAGITDMLTALLKIMNYATDAANPAPVLQDYLDAGVGTVTVGNLSATNTKVSFVSAADVDSAAKLLALVADTGVSDATFTATIGTDTGVDSAGTAVASITSGGVTKDQTWALSGTAEANSVVEIYDGATLLGNGVLTGTAWTYTTTTLAAGAHSLTAKVTDAFGNTTTTSAITGTVDIAALTFTSSASASVTDNATGIQVSTVVYTAAATGSNTVSYSLSGTDAGLFDINSSTGAVTFKTAETWASTKDTGANHVYDFTVTATDAVGVASSQAVALSMGISAANIDVFFDQAHKQSAGKLISSVIVDGGSVFYYWDISGDGTSAGVDYVTHNFLDGIFNKNVSGVINSAGSTADTTDAYRYGTLYTSTGTSVSVALPTKGDGGTTTGYYADLTSVGNSTASLGSNAANATYGDLLAIWDAYNGTGSGTSAGVAGVPAGWAVSSYWSATPTSSGFHARVYLSSGYVGNHDDTLDRYVAVQVL